MAAKKQTKLRMWYGKHFFYWLRNYSFSSFRKGKRSVVATYNGMVYHGGISDRLKGIITAYAWAKSKGYPFRIWFDSPFKLENYLCPNKYEWIPQEKEITNSGWWSRPLFMIGYPPHTLFNSSLRLRQIHIFLNAFTDEVVAKSKFTFDELYHELFRPSDEIAAYVEEHKNRLGEWNCLAFRFQNLLGDSLEIEQSLYYKGMSGYSPEDIARRCLEYTKEYAKNSDKQVLICSDSNIFINKVKEIDNCFIVEKEIVHTDFCASDSHDLHLKTFLDFYLIANSKEVVSVGTKEMYPSNFPKTAADINKVPFRRVLI